MALGNLILISAASGTGKTSLVKRLVKEIDNLVVSVSYTTRPRRAKEEDNQSYFFVDSQQFQRMEDAGEFVETAKIFGYCYGTPKKWLLTQLQQGIDIICEVDWQGAQVIKRQFHDAVSIFVLPPSLEILKQRLYERGRDEKQDIELRLQEASHEISYYKEYQYLVINDSFELALNKLKNIIMAQRALISRQEKKHQKLIRLLLGAQAH